MACFGRLVRGVDGVLVAHLPDEDDIRVLTEGVAETRREGLAVACEVMRVTGTIRDCIIDTERMDEILDLIHSGKEQYGSQTFDQHLMDLVNAGTVGFEVAKAAANSPSDFDLKMNLLGGLQGHLSGAGGLSGAAQVEEEVEIEIEVDPLTA